MEGILEQYETVNLSDVKIWFKAGKIKDFPSNRGGCIKYKTKQIAIFNFERRNEWYACQNACPHKMEMVLSRGMTGSADGVPYGAYIVQEAEQKKPQVILLATGSEVEISIKAAILLEQKGIRVRVVSMPSWELFDEQAEDYRRRVLPAGVPVLSIEAGITMGWSKYTGSQGDSLGIDHFGASGPGPTVMTNFGFTPENVVARALPLLK